MNSRYLTPLSFFPAFLAIVIALSGCATVDDPFAPSRQFANIIRSFPATQQQLPFPEITRIAAPDASAAAPGSELYIVVHPAYGVFFQDLAKERFPEDNYRLLMKQFQTELEFISKRAASGATLILVLPGENADGVFSPTYPSYRTYLNMAAGAGRSVYFIYSDTQSSGAIFQDDMIRLYYFIRALRPAKITVAGGYIGRCQREFYNSLTTYIDKSLVFISPQLSTISPDDITKKEAVEILNGLERQDYTLVAEFINQRSGSVNILPTPQPEKAASPSRKP